MSKVDIDARFIDGQRGRLFVLLRHPAKLGGGPCVLLVPPFAEEMNKSRRMLSELATVLAARGAATLLADPYGTGDSEGDLRDADWNVWRDDLARAAWWARGTGWPVTGLLGVRLGCLLAAQLAPGLAPAVERTVFWQPVTSGERYLTQFLRLRVAASMMEDRKETVAELRARLSAGETLEVAGYELAAGLARQIDAIALQTALTRAVGQLTWIEVTRDAAAPLPAAAGRAIEACSALSIPIEPTTAAGEPFWSTTEIVTVPELVSITADRFAPAA